MKLLNPENETFNAFLIREGLGLMRILPSGNVADIPEGRALVCVIVAEKKAVIICEQNEFDENYNSNTNKRWYYVPREKLIEAGFVAEGDFHY